MDTNIPLNMLGAYLREHTEGARGVPHYTRVWQRATAGEIPQIRKDKFSNRWIWDEADLPAIAAACGRTIKAPPARARRAKASE